MVIDSSALVAILMYEAEATELVTAIENDRVRLLSAVSLFESAIVLESNYGQSGSDVLDEFVHKSAIIVEPVTIEQVKIARLAYRTYGKGRHPAALNFGDCFAYALAKIMKEPLLFKGNDFNQTDIKRV